jgi:hypothetical protein
MNAHEWFITIGIFAAAMIVVGGIMWGIGRVLDKMLKPMGDER